jgi:hypothetical protein
MKVNFIEYSFLMHHLDLHETHYNDNWPIILIAEDEYDGAYVLVRSLIKLPNNKYGVKL